MAGSAPSGGALYLRDANGTEIQPLEVGTVQSLSDKRSSAELVPRSNCVKDSWIADPSKENYTRPADGSQLLVTGVVGAQDVQITRERSQSWTSTLSMSIGFEDVISLSASFEESFTKEESESTTRVYHVDQGQSGDVVFTPYLQCSSGEYLTWGLG